MALVPLTRITFRTMDGESHFFLNRENLTKAHVDFLMNECGLTNVPVGDYDRVAPGFYVESDLAQFKAALAAVLVG